MVTFRVGEGSADEAARLQMPVTPQYVRLKRPGRWLATALVCAIACWFVVVLATNESLQWSTVLDYLFDSRVLEGVLVTVIVTAGAELLAITVGSVIAVMRISPNGLLRAVGAVFVWFFRGTPALVQLIFWFNFSTIFPTLFGLDTNQVISSYVAAVLGLGLAESAYQSEVVRSGFLSVDPGQIDAAKAFGLSRMQIMSRVIMPQAMKVIVPPTGNSMIGMLKYTSLASVIAVPELLQAVQSIYTQTFEVMPLLIVASIWYLALTSILSVVQARIERYYGKSSHRSTTSATSRGEQKARSRTRRIGA